MIIFHIDRTFTSIAILTIWPYSDSYPNENMIKANQNIILSVLIFIKLSVTLSQSLRLSVTNNGPVIPAEYLRQ